MHPHAFLAARAAHCAGEQDLFWDMHHYIFAYQGALTPEILPSWAEELGADVDAFNECLASDRHSSAIRDDAKRLARLGITGTPSYLLGQRIPESDDVKVLEILKGGVPPQALIEKIEALLATTSAQD